MGETKLSNPRVHVIMADGSEWEAQTRNPDLLRYERTGIKHKWPTPSQSPIWWLTFISWSAGLREGRISSDITWEAFSTELCDQVTNADEADPVVPTQPEPDTD